MLYATGLRSQKRRPARGPLAVMLRDRPEFTDLTLQINKNKFVAWEQKITKD